MTVPPPAPTVCVVDDDPDVLISLRFLLETEGFSVRTFANGPDLLASRPPSPGDCLIIDYKMAGMDGLAVTKLLRAKAATQPLPVLMLTGMTDESSTRAGFEAGVTDYLTKPFSTPQLTARIRACLARTHLP